MARWRYLERGATGRPSPVGKIGRGRLADPRMVELTGFEPATSALQGRRSPN